MEDTPTIAAEEVEAPPLQWRVTTSTKVKQKEKRAPAVHDWFGGYYGRVARPQYVALLEAVGSWKIARKKMDDVIIWRDDQRAPDKILRDWELDWQENRLTVSDHDVQKMRQRIRAFQEAKSWMVQDSAAEAAISLNTKAAKGELKSDTQVQLNYANMSTAFLTEKIAGAFGTAKPPGALINQFFLDTGQPRRARVLKPPTRKQLKAAVVDAEFREVTDADGGS